MIIGVTLRNFKIYKSISYIPISNGNSFCGLIGKNGIGKSSILEALDYFFNSNNNKDFKKNNTGSPRPEDCYVVPVFCISKSVIQKDFTKFQDEIIALSDSIWDVINNLDSYSIQINANYYELVQQFSQHITSIKDIVTKENYCLLPLGQDIDGNISLGFFKDGVFIDRLVPDEVANNIEQKQRILQDKYLELFEAVKNYFQYVFIPKDIEPENLVRFETQELQTLLNTNLYDIISKYLTKSDIMNISKGLKEFVDDLSSKLPNYKFKAPTYNQPNLKADKIYNLIVQDFFSLRQLHKEGKGGKDLPLKELSSGEKQQAILTLIHSIISGYRSDNTKNLIIAVDEPESSLHISACYEQFEKLYEISNKCCQMLISSHWYGFIPAIPQGTITNITLNDSRNRGHIFNIQKYREEIKHQSRDYAIQNHSQLPIDISLKSSNDFVQSILMSVISRDSYNWLICEGSSDKIYLDAYLKNEIDLKKLRIIPVCTASEVKNTYNRLQVLFEELRQGNQLKGKVYLLIDTDANPIEFPTNDNLENNLLCRRIVNNDNDRTTSLVKITASPKAPNTDIEDVLNGVAFHKTLLELKKNGFDSELDFVTENDEIEEVASYYALDLRPTERKQLDVFFNGNNGNNKVIFARQYVEVLSKESYKTPNWISEIKHFFNNPHE